MTWIFALCFVAFGAPEKMYETRDLKLDLTLPVVDTPHLRPLLRRELAALELRRVTVVNQGGSTRKVRVRRLQLPQLLAALTVLAYEDLGAEADLIVGNLSGEFVPVTVWWDEDFRLAYGDPIDDLIVAGRTAESLAAEYGLAPLVAGPDRTWERRSVALLSQTLDLLDKDERHLLEGVAFKRVAAASAETIAMIDIRQGERMYAAFVVDGNSARIELYDHALSPASRFVGDPWDPKPDALRTLLHEIAHAIAFADFRAEATAFFKLVAEAEALHKKESAHIEHMNALVDQYNARPSRKVRATIQSMETRLAAYEVEAEALRERIDAFAPSISEKPTTAAAGAFEEILAGNQAPTWYGRRSIEEAFAECFSLYKADPAALERVLPDVYAWFESGDYLPYLEMPASR